jgi:hypothetical protein
MHSHGIDQVEESWNDVEEFKKLFKGLGYHKMYETTDKSKVPVNYREKILKNFDEMMAKSIVDG